MIWGIEGRWIWLPPSVVAGMSVPSGIPTKIADATQFRLNWWLADDGDTLTLPCYRVHKISGLMGTGDSGDTRDNRVGAEGEIPRKSYRRGKTIVFEGNTQASTRAALRTAEEKLTTAFSDQSAEGLAISIPHPLYQGGSPYRYFYARALTCDIGDEAVFSPGRRTLGHESAFVISIRNARSGGVSYTDQAAVTYP